MFSREKQKNSTVRRVGSVTNRAAHAGRYEADTRGDHRTRQQVLSESDQELGVDGTGE